MNLDELREKIEKICAALNNPNLEPRVRTQLENDLEQACISYYKLRKFTA